MQQITVDWLNFEDVLALLKVIDQGHTIDSQGAASLNEVSVTWDDHGVSIYLKE